MADILKIADGVLKECTDKSVTSVTIPEGVTEIGGCAFKGCESLASVEIPSSVTAIGKQAFRDCKSLSSVVIPSSVTVIGDFAFNGCKSLSSVLIPSSVRKIGDRAFEGCESLSSVEFGGTAEEWEDVEGNRELLAYIPASSVKFSDDEEFDEGCLHVKNGVLEECTDKDVKSVVIPESVTGIGEEAFKDCTSLSSVVIPSSVTEIGWSAFCGCTSLSSVVIPESVTEIGGDAFKGCTSLLSVVIPPSVTEIGGDAFKGCNINELSHPCLTIKGGLVVEESKLLYCASQSSSITIPEGVTKIGRGAFSGCKSLLSVEIPSSVTEIGSWAFDGCKSLTSVEIPSSVTAIGGFAFRCCTSLLSVEIPSSVTEIGEAAFKHCEALSSVEFGGTKAQWDAVKGKDNLFNGDVPATSVKCADGEWQKPVLLVEAGVAVRCLDKSASSVEIPAGVTEIGEWAFDGCTSLASVEIPEGVTEIGGSAFYGCESLSSVEIPSSVAEIGVWAFKGCTSLMSVVIPESVTKIDNGAFEDCKSLAKVTLGDDFKKVPSEWFDDLNEANPNYEIVCTEGSSTYKAIKRSSNLKLHLKSLNVTKEDLELQKAKNKKIAEVRKAGVDAILPMLLEGVADSSFSLLSNTKSATVAIVQIAENNAVFKLGADSSKWMDKAKKAAEILSDSAKSGREIYDALLQTKLPLAEIPAKKAENLTLKAGADKTVRLFCKGEVKVYGGAGQRHSIFPKDVRSAELFGVTAIGWGAFKGCTALASVVIPESVTKIGKNAFEGCTALASVVIPESVTEIDDSAFEGCKALASVVIPESVTAIGWHAFEGCKALASVVIPESVTEIGKYAFEGCESLTAVEFGGTMAQWDAVKGKDNLFNGNVPATGVKCADGEWQEPVVLVEDGVAVECLDKSAASVEIPAGVTTIGWRAFQDCKALASVVIPESVTTIGWYAFCHCESLASVAFGGTVAQWKAMKKGAKWHVDVPATSVKCSDGEAEL
ncbi:leucine-rich repeat domain-containing protein [Treponema saccharophilum]|uniref:Surface antigen BspA n=1 Tax=Treponema saccharophilum DSM 2985 TaxID=907348 RepID=H7EJU0_9SPIR|nr:leucine-rich repeat domain-containing protein [Treponema saccharophilum]EIC02210.1 hypothetical protein TresaDRAFT_2190 [Treponema saccharophilum DSM 2985]BDC96666.1 hypothetical protein TRSA_17650 [Treponema saccharophilum]